MRRLPAQIGILVLLAGCASGSPGGGAQAAADSTTRAVYNDDYAGVTQNFDDALKGQVTRVQVGQLSDTVHKLGDYKGLTYVSNDATKNEYTYRAAFSNGSANVVLRLDADGKIAAYRVLMPSR